MSKFIVGAIVVLLSAVRRRVLRVWVVQVNPKLKGEIMEDNDKLPEFDGRNTREAIDTLRALVKSPGAVGELRSTSKSVAAASQDEWNRAHRSGATLSYLVLSPELWDRLAAELGRQAQFSTMALGSGLTLSSITLYAPRGVFYAVRDAEEVAK